MNNTSKLLSGDNFTLCCIALLVKKICALQGTAHVSISQEALDEIAFTFLHEGFDPATHAFLLKLEERKQN